MLPKIKPAEVPANTVRGLDERLQLAGPVRKVFNKVFPDHWTFLLGEIALYSFVMLLLTGVFLTLFFDPSMKEVVYDGSYTPLKGVEMSAAYASTLDISFDVRGGLIMRQIHHWSALLFMAAMTVHMFRIFFSGAFRKPRELNWLIGITLITLGIGAGFAGYSLPDDALSGTGLRIIHAVILSIPLVGTWVAYALFDGEFPGEIIISRLYIVHVLLIPGAIIALISVHLALIVKQKHTQFPGPKRTEKNVVGVRMFPGFAAKGAGFSFFTFGVLALLGGWFQINPVWLFGPYKGEVVSAATQPDFYVGWIDGLIRLWPSWETRAFDYTIPAVFWPAAVIPGIIFTGAALWPFIEAKLNRDTRHHNLLQRPRDVPARTGLGAMMITFLIITLISGGNDLVADKFDISLNAMTWAGRIGLVVAPPLAYFIAYRICLGLQQHDREILAHGVETGVIVRSETGHFSEVHQPLAPRGEKLEYRGWVVPKKMNKLGALIPAQRGFFVPIEDTDTQHRKEKELT